MWYDRTLLQGASSLREHRHHPSLSWCRVRRLCWGWRQWRRIGWVWSCAAHSLRENLWAPERHWSRVEESEEVMSGFLRHPVITFCRFPSAYDQCILPSIHTLTADPVSSAAYVDTILRLACFHPLQKHCRLRIKASSLGLHSLIVDRVWL